MLKFTLNPFDVLFFGDGRPFDKGSDALSVFPPYSYTVASSIFARMYQLKGIKYEDKPLIKAVYGPFLQKDDTIYFSSPMDIVTNGELNKIDILQLISQVHSNDTIIDCACTDLGENISNYLWLTGKSHKEIKPFKGYISLEGLKKWQIGEMPCKEDLLRVNETYDYEERIGIHIDDNTGTTMQEDGLYRVLFTRLKNNFKFVFWIDFNVTNLSNYFKNEDDILQFYTTKPCTLKLGGEGKSIYYECKRHDFKSLFQNFKVNFQERLHKVLFLTQGIFTKEHGKENIITYIYGFKTGVIGKYSIAGINQKRDGSNARQTTLRAIPSGSVIYIENSKSITMPIDFFPINNDFIGSNLILVA